MGRPNFWKFRMAMENTKQKQNQNITNQIFKTSSNLIAKLIDIGLSQIQVQTAV